MKHTHRVAFGGAYMQKMGIGLGCWIWNNYRPCASFEFKHEKKHERLLHNIQQQHAHKKNPPFRCVLFGENKHPKYKPIKFGNWKNFSYLNLKYSNLAYECEVFFSFALWKSFFDKNPFPGSEQQKENMQRWHFVRLCNVTC